MDGTEAKKIIDACNERNINFKIVTMMPSNIIKNENTVVKAIGDNIFGFRKPIYSENNGVDGIEMLIMPMEQLCEFHITADYSDMKSLCEEIGVDLDDDELKLLIRMDKYDSHLEPETGDYNRLKYISGKAYELLTSEQKQEYDEAKAAYEEEQAKKLGKNQAAQISMN